MSFKRYIQFEKKGNGLSKIHLLKTPPFPSRNPKLQSTIKKWLRFKTRLDFSEYTPFQRSVWKALQKIPYGETRSYQWVANKIGNPKAVRAVGQAVGANPIPIICTSPQLKRTPKIW